MDFGKTKALLYTNCEADTFKVLKGDITLEMLINDLTNGDGKFVTKNFECPELGTTDMKAKCLLFNDQYVFALFFDNGMIYEMGRGFRSYRDEKFINKRYQILEDEKNEI